MGDQLTLLDIPPANTTKRKPKPAPQTQPATEHIGLAVSVPVESS